MKLSIEGKVAASVAAAFAALTVGVIAQENSGDQNAGPNAYGPTNNPEVSTHMIQRYDSSSAGRTDVVPLERPFQF
jgi:hypothetical protein